MKHRGSKLESVRRLFESRERQVAQKLGVERARISKQQEDLAVLSGLVAQYRAELDTATRMSAGQLARFRRFYRHMAGTINDQQQTVKRLEAAADVTARELAEAHGERRSVDRLLTRRSEERALDQRRQDRRRAADDHARRRQAKPAD